MTTYSLPTPSSTPCLEVSIWGWIDPGRAVEGELSANDIVLPVQTHSCNVKEVGPTGESLDGEGLEETDALITRQRGLTIGVRTADCVPILLYAPDIMAVASIHAGWKGTIGRIAAKTVERLVIMGADPARLQALLANCICLACYEVGEELAAEFLKIPGLEPCVTHGRYVDPLGERTFDERKPHLDLCLANKIILEEAGVPADNISSTEICTRHSGLSLPSWRRNPGTRKRMITWIRLPEA